MASARLSLLAAGGIGSHRLQAVVTIGRVGHRREAYREFSEGTWCAFTKSIKGEELQATLIVHDDGRKEWDWMRHEWQGSSDLKTVIEQAADADPQAERWTYQSFTIRQNQSR